MSTILKIIGYAISIYILLVTLIYLAMGTFLSVMPCYIGSLDCLGRGLGISLVVVGTIVVIFGTVCINFLEKRREKPKKVIGNYTLNLFRRGTCSLIKKYLYYEVLFSIAILTMNVAVWVGLQTIAPCQGNCYQYSQITSIAGTILGILIALIWMLARYYFQKTISKMRYDKFKL